MEPKLITQSELGRLLGVTQQYISKKIKDETLQLSEDRLLNVKDSVLALYTGTTHKTEIQQEREERARLTKWRADTAEKEYWLLDGSLVEKTEVLKTWNRVLTELKLKMLAITNKVAHRIENENKNVIKVKLNEEIKRALRGATQFSGLGE